MDFIEIGKAIIFGVVEGITEWLPVSSTGHLILLDEFIRLNVSASFKEMFLVVVQLSAVFAVLTLYFKKFFPASLKREDLSEMLSLWTKIVISCVPAAFVGLLWDDDLNALFYNYQTVALMLILVGAAFIAAENYLRNKAPKINSLSQITFASAFLIGFFQLMAAVFPGTSRSGAVIIGALLLGISRTIAVEYAFLLAVPVMFGASALKLLKFGFQFSNGELITLMIGMITAFIASVISIKFLIGYVKKRDFKIFGFYRITLGLAIFIYFFVWGK
ncbi:MAG: undecaprenyl-diphosphate phosphatase [Endomicrobium sp.]|jgi:undecaprenyl-diphosphatase|nr:undecaprenyl-diphosphate phosphatase [Endomicrobium sp.]